MTRTKPRNKRIQIAETTIERLGRILSEHWDIKVVFQANRCETSGKVIYLPSISDNADDEFLQAMQGHLDHEAGHVTGTDFRVMKQFAGKPKLLTIWNALEDPRQERLWCQKYPGARLNLSRSSEWSYKRVAELHEEVDPVTGDKKQVRDWDQLSDLGKLLYAGSVYCDNDFNDNHWFIKEVVPADIMTIVKDKLEDLFRAAVAAPDSMAVVPLAEEIMTRLQEVEPPEPEKIDPADIPDNAVVVPPQAMPSPQQQVMQKQGEPDPDAPPVVVASPGHNADPDDDDTGQPGQEQSAADDDAEDDDGEEIPSEEPRNFDPSKDQLAKDAEITDRKKQIRSASQRLIKTNTDSYLVFTTAGDQVEKITPGNRAEFGKFLQETAAMVSPMRRQLVRVLTARKQSSWEGGKERGKIDKRRLYRVPLGTSKKVFKQQTLGEELDAAVLIAVDHSDSMNNSKLQLAARMSSVLGQTLDPLGVPFSILGWSTGSSDVADGRKNKATEDERECYTRWGNLWTGVYKGFNETWTNAGPKVLEMPRHSQHNTYDGESVRMFAQMLMARPEKRKILFIFNDGEPCPNWGDDRQAHINYAHDCAKAVEAMVQTVVFGVMTDAVKDIYANTVVVHNLNDLPKVAMTQLMSILLDGKSRRGMSRVA